MKAKSCWDDQETHAAGSAWLLEDVGAEEAEVGAEAGTEAGTEASALAPEGVASRRAGPSTLLRRRSGDSIFQSLMRLWPREGRRPDASSRTMARLRSAFRGSISDLLQEALARDDGVSQERLEAVLRHIVHSSHPEDLWHLRALVYTEVARARSQAEAERRLALLTAQFDWSRGRLKLWMGRG
ncbi:hypothetical protein OU995_23500 [Roseateles sp. SL47]|uniref:hypothetical protein n=1 Tax=Roseateles sp. SL47 TaxID=2995138 RepID=UPI002272171D|nr:hypothetical protein [Roseateles sp. SL47]WAC72482.1 hypothetical protein OU995_23500 [Roseateles sp. SL47]